MLVFVVGCILGLYIGGIVFNIGDTLLNTVGSITAYEIKKALTWPLKFFK